MHCNKCHCLGSVWWEHKEAIASVCSRRAGKPSNWRWHLNWSSSPRSSQIPFRHPSNGAVPLKCPRCPSRCQPTFITSHNSLLLSLVLALITACYFTVPRALSSVPPAKSQTLKQHRSCFIFLRIHLQTQTLNPCLLEDFFWSFMYILIFMINMQSHISDCKSDDKNEFFGEKSALW